jgi:hypothetical protein
LATRPQHRAHGRRNLRRLVDELPPGEADDVVAEQLQLDVAGGNRLEGDTATMRRVAVELDDQATVRPMSGAALVTSSRTPMK